MQSLLKPLASLRLTVVLLALSIVVIFAGTWAQVDHDVWTVQKRYFHTFFTWIHLQLFLPRAPLPDGNAWKPVVEFLRPLGFPMLGGYALIGLLLMNLLAAHTLRFKYTIKRTGILLIHGGIVLLILGEVIASVWQVEGQMPITEGQTVSYTQDIRRAELAVIDPSSADHDDVTVVPAARLIRQDIISYPTLPFQIRVDRYYANSVVLGPQQARSSNVSGDSLATAGYGVGAVVLPRRKFTGAGADAMKVDAPSAFITLISPNGVELGTYLVSLFLDEPQELEFNGKKYLIDLRWKRTYKPYSLTLLEFRHDTYTGTQTPKNFSSRVRLVDPARGEDRDVLIWMNHPLRYAGETFYQSGYRGADTTILQVVRNPGWLIPYISCIVVGAGMLIHFGAMLLKFLGKLQTTVFPTPVLSGAKGRTPSAKTLKNKYSTAPQQYVLKPRAAGITFPLIATALCALWLLSSGRPPKHADTPFDLNNFARVPISHEGRVMPLDTLARVSLRVMSGKSELRTDEGKIPAIRWLAQVLGNPDQTLDYKVFRIDDPDVKTVLGLDRDQKMFSYRQFEPKWNEFFAQVQMAERVERTTRDRYQRAVITLAGHIRLFDRLAQLDTLYIAPPTAPGEDWKTFAHAAQEAHATRRPNPGLQAFATMISAYRHDQPTSFNASVGDYLSYLGTNLAKATRKAAFEVMFNNFEPFIKSIYLYVGVFMLTCLAWIITPLRPMMVRTAFWVLVLTFLFHTLGLVARVYIQGRPPVTNLYSSAIFIGWAAVGLSIFVEWIYRNGIGSLAASVIAFPTLIIAHFLAGSGDTMQMLQAVLDTNIWLATHVVVITMGYSAMFLAGTAGMVYVTAGGLLSRIFATDARKTLSRIIYGVVCFAMLFSFVGTVLGGIWADQSWGRFWGWDPKENGAALIVLWNAIILHARWGGLIRERGLALLAIFGNVITAWSWFGTNMMGVGLHSYGFMDSAVFWLGLFMASQLLLIALGSLPLRQPHSAAA